MLRRLPRGADATSAWARRVSETAERVQRSSSGGAAEPQHRAGACWYELASEKGEPYYWHSESGETSWEPPAWTKEADPKSGHDYFLHAASGESRWELPAGAAALVHGEP